MGRLSVNCFNSESAHRISIFGILNLHYKFTSEFKCSDLLNSIFCSCQSNYNNFLEIPRPRICTQRKVAADIMQFYDIYEKYLSMWGIFTEI
jgi:hypothetical protein